jgi:Ca-activated chloride channel family protein
MLPPRSRRILTLALPLLVGAGALYAARPPMLLHAQVRQEMRPRPRPPIWPSPPIWGPSFQQMLTIDSVHIRTAIAGGIAQTEVEQTWRNDTDRAQEGSYLFPLPEGATVSDFALYDGDRKMAGRLLDKDQAADTYEGIVRRQRDPALLRYVGRGAYEVKLYPVPPHATRKVTLKYAEALPTEGGDARKYVYSFLGGTLGGGAAGGPLPRETTVQVTLQDNASLANIYSPTHDVSIRRTGDRAATVSWEAKDARVKDDFILYYSTVRHDPVGLGLLAYNVSLPGPRLAAFTPGAEGKRDSGYFLLMASPKMAALDTPALPKRVVLVLDRSGSMAGPKIEQARNALAYVLQNLRPTDEFNVMTFNESNDILSVGGLLRATPDNVRRGLAFVKGIEAEGGTNIHDALDAALKMFPREPTPLLRNELLRTAPPETGREGGSDGTEGQVSPSSRSGRTPAGAANKEVGFSNMTIFLTDGLPTVGETDDAKITADARVLSRARGVRLFDFGVGYDVDVHFLDRLAEANRGDSDYVRPEEDIEAKVSRFYKKVASPVLTDVHVEIGGARTAELYPRPSELPDLFTGSQLLIAGRYTGSGAVTARLTGNVGGKPVSYALSTTLPAVADTNDFLPRLWATRKIGYLLDSIRLRQTDASGGPDDPELVSEIVRLSKEYGVVTPYTSFLVTDGNEENQPFNNPIAMHGIRRRRGSVFASPPFAGGGYPGGGGFGGPIMKSPAPLAPPAQAYAALSGAVATTQSQTLHAAKRASVANGLAGYDEAQAKAVGDRVRTVGAKTFTLQGGVWTDSAYDAAKQKDLTVVQAFSDAHFALLKVLPRLAAYTSLGDNVLVVLDDGKALKISATEGVKTLDAAALGRLK